MSNIEKQCIYHLKNKKSGIAFIRIGDIDEAIDSFQRAIQTNPKNIQAKKNRNYSAKKA